MGEVVSLTEARAARFRRRAEAAATHPCLRWVAAPDGYRYAHRRDADGGTTCGMRGDVLVAPIGTTLCVDCFPATASGLGDAARPPSRAG